MAMPKNILIFSDGTGQAGGLLPDELTSNVYKLYRAVRCGPDSTVDPAAQLAFYDPGLGSQKDSGLKIGFLRRIYNFFSSGMGVGITKNIIDGYSAILELWEPGDRIFLFGFSRGAYTVRCLGGVLGACGVPERMEDGSTLRRDPVTVRCVAAEAVKHVYQYGSSVKGDPFKELRMERARAFRKKYGSGTAPDHPDDRAKTVPYFIGVWDTVAAIGTRLHVRIIIALAGLIAIVGLSALIAWLLTFVRLPFLPSAGLLILLCIGVLLAWYLGAHVTFHSTNKRLYWAAWRMTFYDRNLNPNVRHARHAISIDENRADFARVEWTWSGAKGADGREPLMKQYWFAGNHSDIGGSYSENESRLSDIALKWMLDEASSVEHPIVIDQSHLHMFPDPRGMQHDECKVGVPILGGLWRFSWTVGHRGIPRPDTTLHPSVIERVRLAAVRHYDEMKPYRPESLRLHRDLAAYYEGVPGRPLRM
jgi:uncharacterized protein (DUF2235 family)